MELRGARIVLVTPAPDGATTGNRITAERWAMHLTSLGADVELLTTWRADGPPPDAMVALHAVKSGDSVMRFRRARPDAPVVVGLAGTDVYGEGLGDAGAAALARADRIVALQAHAIAALSTELRGRARVIVQSAAAPIEPCEEPSSEREVLVLAHLRAVKDPLLPARAARRLPADSRIQVALAGEVLDTELGEEARREAAENPRFHWLGPLAHDAALARLGRAFALALPSRTEGGANVIGEAAVRGVAVLAARNDGATGLLGADHPGLFEVGDEVGAANLLARMDAEPEFHADLRARSKALAPAFAPERERAAWQALFAEIERPARP